MFVGHDVEVGARHRLFEWDPDDHRRRWSKVPGRFGEPPRVIDLRWYLSASRDERDALHASLRAGRRSEHGRVYWALSCIEFDTCIDADLVWMRSQPRGRTAPARVESVLRWLREDPFNHNSGYKKQKVVRALRRFEFTEPQAESLRTTVLEIIQRGRRSEFPDLLRLARKLDSSEFRVQLAALIARGPKDVADRATLILGLCERSDPPT